MATTLTLNTISTAGTNETLVAADVTGNNVPNTNGRSFVIINNGGGSSINATITATVTLPGVTVSGPVIAIAAGVRKMIDLPSTSYVNDANGNVLVTCSSVTSVTIGAFELP